MQNNYKQKFIDRTIEHNKLVNKYAQKIGHTYSYHDYDKLSSLLDDYSLMFKGNITDDENKRYNNATIAHISNNPHHPEFFLNKVDSKKLKSFTRENPIMNLDCSRMTDPAIQEMCCDWCAMSEEFGNSPLDWADKHLGVLGDVPYKNIPTTGRWLFTDRQLDYIYDLLIGLWY